MTPVQYLARIDALFEAKQYEALVKFVRQHDSEMLPQLTYEQMIAVSDVMHIVDAIVDPDGPPPNPDADVYAGRAATGSTTEHE